MPRFRDIDLAAYDRLDALLFAGAVKGDRTEHISVIGKGNGGMPALCGSLRNVGYTAGSVKQTVFAVKMKVNKSHRKTLLPFQFFFIPSAIAISLAIL